MPDSVSSAIRLLVNGQPQEVAVGTTVAVAILLSGANHSRRSVSGEPRGPLCGMGICMECRATINGLAQQRTCQLLCVDGMEIVTDE